METALDWKNKGNQEFKAQNYEKAIEYYSKAIELDSSNITFFSNRAVAFMNSGKFEKALEDADKCLEMDSNYVKGYTRKGQALLSLKKFAEAEEIYKKGLEMFPDNQEMKQKIEEIGQQKQKEAFNIQELLQNPMIQQFMQKNPQMAQQLLSNPELMKNPQMLQNLMKMFQNQQFQQPQQEQQEQQPQSQFNPGEKKPEPQQTQQEQPKQQQPQSDSEFMKLKKEGNQLYLDKKVDEALEKYNKCIELEPEDILVRNNKAACYIYKKDYERAMEIVNEAIKVYNKKDYNNRSFVNLAKVLARKGRIYHLQGDLENAIKAYKESLQEDRVNKISAIVRQLEREKKKQEQLAYIDPKLSEDHRQKGNEYYKQSKFAEAIKEYEEAQKRNPKDAKVHNNLSACFMKMMRYQDAQREIEKCLKLEPQNVKALLRLAQIFFNVKEYHKAIKKYEEVLKLEPQNQTAQQGIQNTQMKIASSMDNQDDEERVKRAMADPEIQAIMIDPMVRIALEQMKANPQKAMEYFNDPTLKPKLQKLIQAGILRTGQIIQLYIYYT